MNIDNQSSARVMGREVHWHWSNGAHMFPLDMAASSQVVVQLWDFTQMQVAGGSKAKTRTYAAITLCGWGHHPSPFSLCCYTSPNPQIPAPTLYWSIGIVGIVISSWSDGALQWPHTVSVPDLTRS